MVNQRDTSSGYVIVTATVPLDGDTMLVKGVLMVVVAVAESLNTSLISLWVLELGDTEVMLVSYSSSGFCVSSF